MIVDPNHRPPGCTACTSGAALDFQFTMAFQPIVNVTSREIFAHEALVRGLDNESAGDIFKRVNEDNRCRFDQACHVKAIPLSSQLGMKPRLSINFMPKAVHSPEPCIRGTLEAAESFAFPTERIICEISESEYVDDRAHLRGIILHYKQRGFLTAIDDFGAGYAGLNLLADIQVDLVKLDMTLIRDVDRDRGRRIIIKGILQMCRELSIEVIAEGVETRGELSALRALGLELFQGYHFAKPALRSLAIVPPEAYGHPA